MVSSSSIAPGISFRKCRIYFLHFSAVTVSQNSSIPLINASFVRGFTSRRKYSFILCHIFSIGLKSGDFGGVRHQLTPFSAKKLSACRDVCLGSLSCMNLYTSEYSSSMKGRSVGSRMLVNRLAFIFPSKMQDPES